MGSWQRIMLMAGAAAFTITLTGCKQDIARLPAEAPAIQEGTITTVAGALTGNLMAVAQSTVHPETEQEDIRRALGEPSSTSLSPMDTGYEWIDAEIWRYNSPLADEVYTGQEAWIQADLEGLAAGHMNEQFVLAWGLDGRLIEAVLYYKDEQGYIQSNWLVIGSMSGSSSADNRLADEHGLRIGETVELHASGEAYSLPGGERAAVSFAVQRGQEYVLTGLTDRFAKLEGSGKHGWVPVWLLTPEAAGLTSISPERMILLSATSAYLQPGYPSQAVELQPQERVVGIATAGEWIAVVPVERGAEEKVRALWVKRSEVEFRSEGGLSKLFEDKSATYSEIEVALERVLPAEAPQDAVKALFGEPHFIEPLHPDYDETGEPSRWRYESGDSQLLIDWTGEGAMRYHRLDRRGAGAADTAAQAFAWRTQLELAHSYVLGQNDEVLLLYGDDGYVSGLHEHSNITALEPDSGRKLWERDLGHAYVQHIRSEDQQWMMLGGPVDEKTTSSEYWHRMEVLDTATGQTKWKLERSLPQPVIEVQYAMSGEVAALSYTSGQLDDPTKQQTIVEAYARSDGRQLWRKELERPGKVVYQLTAGERLLIQYNEDTERAGSLVAYEPVSGNEVWRAPGQAVEANNPLSMFSYDHRGHSDTVWSYTPTEWVQLELASGVRRTVLERGEDSMYEVIDNRYAVRQRAKEGLPITYGGEIVSSLIELDSGQVLWTVPGKLERVVIRNDTLYGSLAGHLQAIRMSDGHKLWASDLKAPMMQLQFFQDMLLAADNRHNLIVFDPADGTALYRMGHVMASGIFESGVPWMHHAIMTVANQDTLYIGSGNGYFSKVERLTPDARARAGEYK